MRILIISNMYPSNNCPYYGSFVENIKKELEKKDIEIELAVIKGKSKNKLEKFFKYVKFFLEVITKVRRSDYDLIYVHYILHSLIPLLFVKIKKPLVLHAHGSDVFVNNKIGAIIQKFNSSLIKKSSLIIVPSLYFKEVIKKKFNIKESKIFISPSGGIDTKVFKPMNLEKNNIFTIGYVSRIDKGKGWDIFLRAVKVLKDKNLNFKVIMIGDGEEKSKLIKLIKNLKLEKYVEYLGAKPHKELPFYFNKMDLFVFPTVLKESLGLVGLEAMACGVPIVGSNIGGLPSYIKDGINGKLFEAGNVNELAKNIEYFINLDKINFEIYKKEALKTAKLYEKSIVIEKLYFKLKEFEK